MQAFRTLSVSALLILTAAAMIDLTSRQAGYVNFTSMLQITMLTGSQYNHLPRHEQHHRHLQQLCVHGPMRYRPRRRRSPEPTCLRQWACWMHHRVCRKLSLHDCCYFWKCLLHERFGGAACVRWSWRSHSHFQWYLSLEVFREALRLASWVRSILGITLHE
jgi:hypothetical protein